MDSVCQDAKSALDNTALENIGGCGILAHHQQNVPRDSLTEGGPSGGCFLLKPSNMASWISFPTNPRQSVVFPIWPGFSIRGIWSERSQSLDAATMRQMI
jgi:hypothetical protein